MLTRRLLSAAPEAAVDAVDAPAEKHLVLSNEGIRAVFGGIHNADAAGAVEGNDSFLAGPMESTRHRVPSGFLREPGGTQGKPMLGIVPLCFAVAAWLSNTAPGALLDQPGVKVEYDEYTTEPRLTRGERDGSPGVPDIEALLRGRYNIV
jgi:hypothetical protein